MSKLDASLFNLASGPNLLHLYKLWSKWMRGEPGSMKPRQMQDGVHGVTHIRNGQVESVEIQSKDPLVRQGITVVHEALHVVANPNQPDHRDLHALAVGLALHVFPEWEKGGTVFDKDELLALNDIEDALDLEYTDEDDEEFDEDDYEDEEVGDSDLFARKKRKKKKLLKVAKSLLLPGLGKIKRKRRASPKMAAEVKNTWGGPAVSLIRACYEVQEFLLPVKGIRSVTSRNGFRGYKAPTFEAYWDQMLASLNAGANIAVQGFGKADVIAGVPTTATLAPATRVCAAHVFLGQQRDVTRKEEVEITHFTLGGTPLTYILGLTGSEAEWFIMAVLNDRGSALANADNNGNVQIAANAMTPGATLSIRSINMRDLTQ